MLTRMYANCAAFLQALKKDERGVTAIEYGLIAVAVAAVLATVLGTDGIMLANLTSAFESVAGSLEAVIPEDTPVKPILSP